MPFLAPGESKKALAIVASMCLVAWYRNREPRWSFYDDTGKEKKQARTASSSSTVASENSSAPQSWRHHEIVSYLLENAMIYSVPTVAYFLTPNVDSKNLKKTALIFLIRSAVTVNILLLLQKLSADFVYGDVRYFFTKKKPSSDPIVIIKDFIRCNLVNDLITTVLQTLLISSFKEVAYKSFLNPPKIKVVPLLMKLFLARIVVDVGFYITHRALHSDLIYATFHKRHHQHKEPRLQTNFHFTATDLFFEAAAPLFLTEAVFRALGIPMSRWEQEIVFTHHVWYEASSHTGKEVPTVTWFPELSPLVDWFFDSDSKLVFYHTAHHRLFNCNYSISPWPDRLMGSYRIDTPTEVQDEELIARGKRDEEEEEEVGSE